MVTTGNLIPFKICSYACLYLALSGIIGLAIGDSFLFRAFVILGTRLTLLIFTISPIIAAIAAWIMLGEILGLSAILGIAVTLAGVAWVTAERSYQNSMTQYADKGSKTFGIIMAVLGAAGQAVGLVLAKAGMADGLAPLPATFVRMVSAGLAIWMFSLLRRDIKETFAKFKDKKALLLAACGSICGPFLGVWMSLVAVKNTEAGIAAAIMATVPVLVIPLVIIVYKEKVSVRAVFGAVLASAGVIILFIG